MAERCLQSPMGPLCIVTSAERITSLEWRKGARDDTPLLRRAEAQLLAYLAGTLEAFTLPLGLDCSAFQRNVCAAMSAIPYGETRTYGDLAKQLGVPAQAIGQGCGGNPIPIIIPCHRVVGSAGLGGFSGGIGADTKAWLLAHEGALLI